MCPWPWNCLARPWPLMALRTGAQLRLFQVLLGHAGQHLIRCSEGEVDSRDSSGRGLGRERRNRADNLDHFFSLFPEPVQVAGRETALEARSPGGVMTDDRKGPAKVQGRCL